ncbi:MAG: metallophosphoesterase family protein [Kiritimatiellia bacterium]
MRYALVSDIHANLQAWLAVEHDLARVKPDQVICLGDIIGYGPDPVEVLERVYQRCDHFVMGNHDAAICGQFDPADFNDEARDVILWTRRQLNDDAVKVLNETPYMLVAEKFACSHAEFELPERFDYIFEPAESTPSFVSTQAPILFVGHTHVPCTMRLNPDGTTSHLQPAPFQFQEGCRYLVNVGSVGDPRDGTTRASYVVFDDQAGTVEFRSVVFNVEAYRVALAASGLPTKPYLFEVLEKKQREAISARVRSFQKRSSGPLHRATPQQIARINKGETRRPMQVRRKGEHVFAGASYKPPVVLPKKRRWPLIALLLVGIFAAALLVTWLHARKGEGQGQGPPRQRDGFRAAGYRPRADRPGADRPDGGLGAGGKRKQAEVMAELQQLSGRAAPDGQQLISRGMLERKDAVKQGTSTALFTLNSQAAELAGKKDFVGADKLLREYNGPFAEETKARRLETAKSYAPEVEAQTREARARLLGKLDKGRDKIVSQLASLYLETAGKSVAELAADPDLADLKDFKTLQSEVEEILAMQDNVCVEFLKQKDRELTLKVEGKPRNIRVLEAGDRKIVLKIDEGGGKFAQKTVTLKELAPEDIMSRLGVPPKSEFQKATWQGLLWGRAGNLDRAAESFARSQNSLARDLLEHFRKHPTR